MVRDWIARVGRLDGSVDRRARTTRTAERRRRRGRRCGDSQGGRILPARQLAHERLCGRAEEEQPGRVPRAPAGADAAQGLPRLEARRQRPALRDRPRLRGPRRQRPPDVEPAARTRLHELREDGALHDGRRHRPADSRRERRVGRARLGALRRRRAHVGLGLGGCGVARHATAACSISASRTPTAARRSIASDPTWKVRPTVRRATTTTTSARPTTLAVRSPDGMSQASTIAPGRQRACVDGPSGALRAETHEPIAEVASRAPGSTREPKPGIVVYDVGQNLTGWAELAVEAPRGTAIEIFYSEKLAERRHREHRGQRSRVRAAADRLLRGARRRSRDVDAAIQLQGIPVRPAVRSRATRRFPRA